MIVPPRVDSTFVRRHATGVTLLGFLGVAVALSATPGVPSWLRPTDLLVAEDPVDAVASALLAKPEAIPLPDQLEDQRQATNDPLLLDAPADEGPIEELAVQAEAPAEEAWVRSRWERPERPRFERYAERLGLEAAPLERPCLERRSDGCARRAMDRFFGILERVERGERAARVVHFGDSLIASDKISDRVRRRMQERFGSSGRGYLMGKRFNQFQRGRRSGRGSDGWTIHTIVASLRSLPDRHFGFSGASFTAEARGETLTFEPVSGSTEVAIHHLARPRGGELAVLADGERIAVLDTGRPGEPRGTVTRYALPEGTETVVLRSRTPGPRVYGVALDAEVPGITWSSLGLPGATSAVWLRPGEDEFVRLLAERAPDLAVVMLGGNDGLMLSKKRVSAEAIERDLTRFLDRIRAARPGVDCLLVTPLEAVRQKGGGRLVPKPELQTILRITRDVAQAEGCALWDMYASMGGRGSLERWVDAGLMLGDLIHPKSRGSDLLGEMMTEAIMEAYDDRPDEAPGEPAPGGSGSGSGERPGDATGGSGAD